MILIHLQLFCILIAAFSTEVVFGVTNTDVDMRVYPICYENPKAVHSGHRICHSLFGTAISSILVSMILMIFDVLIPCVDTKVMTII